jgi:hypothetical protein
MDNLWRQEYEDVVLRPQIYGIENAAAAGIGPKMQLALDETPVMYAARMKRTIHVENPADDGQVHTLGITFRIHFSPRSGWQQSAGTNGALRAHR